MTAQESEIETLLDEVRLRAQEIEDDAASSAVLRLADAVDSLVTLLVMHRGREHPR